MISLLYFGCNASVGDEDPILAYLQSILPSEIKEEYTYILISDYSCSACKEDVYHSINEDISHVQYIVMDPQNKTILKERFCAVISKNQLFVDTLGLNKKMGVILNKPLKVIFEEGKWVKSDLWELVIR